MLCAGDAQSLRADVHSSKVPERTTAHPNGTSAIASLVLLSAPSQLPRYRDEVLAPILAASPGGSTHQFELDHPIGGGRIKVFVREAASAEEKRWVEERGEGLYEVRVSVGRGSGQRKVIGEGQGARIVFE